jgi:hypothetical protein
MNSLDTIYDKLELKKAAPPPLKPAPLVSPSRIAEEDSRDGLDSIRTIEPAQPIEFGQTVEPAQPAKSAETVAPAALVSEVDVVKKLEQLAAGSGLNWKVSIVDFLKLLGMDSSYEARTALATELACPADMLKDSARMNVWLHKEVLKKIVESGGNIPQSLLD